MKKKIALAAPFIVTVSSLAACDDPKPEPQIIHGNPPGPDPTTSATTPPTPSESSSAAPLAVASADPKPIIHRNPPPPRLLNAEIDGEVVLKSGGKCTANGKSVTCPDAMKSAAWDKCDNGRIRQIQSTCHCQWSGANPPAPKEIPCP